MSSFKVPDDVLYVFKTYLGPPCASSSSMVCKQWRRMMCVEALTPYHVLSITEHQLRPILAAICHGRNANATPPCSAVINPSRLQTCQGFLRLSTSCYSLAARA